MTQKFEYYDILAVVVPGVLLVGWTAVCFPGSVSLAQAAQLPAGFVVLVLTALAVLFGHLIQTGASIIERLLYRSWGGRPSDQAFGPGIGSYLPNKLVKRIRVRLERWTGSVSEDTQGLFLSAMSLAEADSSSRASKFNGLYAYHRGLLVLAIVAAVMLGFSQALGAAGGWPASRQVAVWILLALSSVALWHRCKQRAFYYVREVLLTAERVIQRELDQES